MDPRDKPLVWLTCLLALVALAVFFRSDIARMGVEAEAKGHYLEKGISRVSEFCGTRLGTDEALAGGNILSRMGVPFKCYAAFGPYPMLLGENSAFYVRVVRYTNEKTAESSPSSFEDDAWITLATFQGREY